MKRALSKLLSLVLTLSMMCSYIPAAAAAQTEEPTGTAGMYKDTVGHVAESAIERWSGYGIVGGYGDSFRPGNAITRAQLAKILSNTLGLTKTVGNPFSDVKEADWFSVYVQRCYAENIMQGNHGKANPNAQITRQQAMVMLARALHIAPEDPACLAGYRDVAQVGAWAAPSVAALVKGHIVGGTSADTLSPASGMTRGALMLVLDRAIVQYINKAGAYVLTDKDGLILVAADDVTLTGKTSADILVTPAADGGKVTFEKAAVTGDVTVQADHATIENKASKLPKIALVGEGSKISKPEESFGGGSGGSGGGSGPSVPQTEDLIVSEAGTMVSDGTYQNVTIAASVGEGDVTMNNVVITGKLTVQGGGSHSIYLKNCTIPNAIQVNKAGGEAPRLHLTKTPVAAVEAKQPVILEAFDAESAITSVVAESNVEVQGEKTTVENIRVPETASDPVTITITKGRVARVEAKQEAVIESNETKAVATVVAEAKVTVPSEAVSKVEVPATAKTEVEVQVTGSSEVEIAVNSDQAVAIQAEAAEQVTVSTEKETAPVITMNGDQVTHVHKWGEWTVSKAATCMAAGTRTAFCVAEGCTEPPAAIEEAIPALGHDFSGAYQHDEVSHWRPCSRCDAVEETAAHTYPQHFCDQEAACTVCGYQKPAGLHTWDAGKITKQPTCMAEGEKTYTCAVCHDTKTEALPVAPHTEVEMPGAAPTCTMDGTTAGKKCSVCGTVTVKQEAIPALGHDFSGAYQHDEASHWHLCSRCDAADAKTAHTWDAGVVSKAPTVTETGIKTYTCTVCGKTRTEALDKLTPQPEKHIMSLKAYGTPGEFSYEIWAQFTENTNGLILTLMSGEQQLDNRWINQGELEFDINSVIPYPTQNMTYTLVLKDQATKEELDRLENCIQVTVSGEAPSFEMEFDTDHEGRPIQGQHSYWLTHEVQGVKLLRNWYDDQGNSRGGGASSIIPVQQKYLDHQAAQDNWTFALRVLTSYELQDGVAQVIMTPAAEKTYVRQVTPQPTDGKITLRQNEYGGVDAVWTGFQGREFYLAFEDENGVGQELSGYTAAGGINDLHRSFPRQNSGTHTYDLVLYAMDEAGKADKTKELARLADDVTITVAGEPLTYDMTFDTQEGTAHPGIHTVTVKTPGLENMFCINSWRDHSNRVLSSGSGTLSTGSPMIEHQNAKAGDQFDLRVLPMYQFDEGAQALTVTMSPASIKTYGSQPVEPTPAASVTFGEVDAMPHLICTPLSNPSGEYLYHPKAIYSLASIKPVENYSFNTNEIMLDHFLQKVTGDTKITFEIYTGTWKHKTLYCKSEADAASVTIQGEAPQFTLEGQQDGTYQIQQTGGTVGQAYLYQVFDAQGRKVTENMSAVGTVRTCLEEGSTVKACTLSWTVGADKKTIAVTMSPWGESTTFSPIPGADTVRTVSTYEELKKELLVGGTVKLGAPIQSDQTLFLGYGSPAILELDGQTLDLPGITIAAGKKLTINGTAANSRILYSAGENHITTQTGTELVLEGGSYQKLDLYSADLVVLNQITAEAGNQTINAISLKELQINGGQFSATEKGENTGFQTISAYDVEKVTMTDVTVRGHFYAVDFNGCKNVAITGGTYFGAIDGLRAYQSDAVLDGQVQVVGEKGSALTAQNNASILVKSGRYEGNGNPACYVLSTSETNSSIVVEDGVFVAKPKAGNEAISFLLSATENQNQLLRVHGGIFSGMKMLMSGEPVRDLCQITGGTFPMDVTAYLEAGYQCTANENGTWTVSKAA